MKARTLVLLLLISLALPAAAQETVGFLARGNLGYDVIADNLVFGGGAGYY